MSSDVTELSGVVSGGSCYVVGKGSSVDGYGFDDRCRIGVNDVGGYIVCDYCVIGPDKSGLHWMGVLSFKTKLVCIEEEWTPDYVDYVYRHSGKPGVDGKLWYSKRTVSAAIGLAKLMGYDKVVCVGFGDELYAKPWRSVLDGGWSESKRELMGIEIPIKTECYSIPERHRQLSHIEYICGELDMEVEFDG